MIRETTDIYFAAMLMTLGHVAVGKRNKGPHAAFAFEITKEDWDRLSTAWLRGIAEIPARPYADNVKALKEWLFA